MSEDCEWLLQPAMWISRLACSTWLRRRHQRQILTSAPINLIADHCLHVCNSTQLKRPQERWKVCNWHFVKCGNGNLCSRNVSSLCSSSWPKKGAFSNKYRRNCLSKKTHCEELVIRKVQQHFEKKVIQGNLSIKFIHFIYAFMLISKIPLACVA